MSAPTVAEYMLERGLSEVELGELVGVKPSTVSRRKGEGAPMSELWLRRIAGEEPLPEREHAQPELPLEGVGRASELPPRPPEGARVVTPAAEPELDFSAIGGYVEGAYRLGAGVIRDTDPLLAGAIEEHAKQAGEAWARWVESEPKVAAFLQRMMVGTPLGEVIAVHVGIGFSYFLARSALARAEQELRSSEPESSPAGDGRGEPAPAL